MLATTSTVSGWPSTSTQRSAAQPTARNGGVFTLKQEVIETSFLSHSHKKTKVSSPIVSGPGLLFAQ